MKTNAIISALCVVGIIGALCSNGEEQHSVVEPRPGALPVQKVVYWSDIPGMKWNWTTQVTNKPSIPSASSFVQKSGDTMTGNLTVENENAFVEVVKTGGKRDYYTTVKAGQIINGDHEHYTATLTLPTVSGTLALTSDIPSTNGLAAKSYVDSHKWDWGTQVTNSPFALHTTGAPYVEVPIGFAATDSGVGYAIPSSASFAGANVHGVESLGVGDGIITNCYGGIGLGMAFNVTNDVAFVWSGRNFNEAIKYGSHGMSTFNVDPHDGPAGFWIGETNLATYLANAGSGEHTHSNLVNGTSKLTLGTDGTVRVGTDQSAFGGPIITIHAGSVFSADTAAHGKTFSTDLVLDYTYMDGKTSPFIIQTNGWRFVAPMDGSQMLWCGPQSWPAYAFTVSDYNSENPTVAFSSSDSDPSCSFSGTITITRHRGKIIPTMDHVLPGDWLYSNDGTYKQFDTKDFSAYTFKGPYPYDTTIAYFGMADIEFFNSSCGISGPYMGTPKYIWGIGKFQYNGYTYTFPYTDNNGSGNYTLATTSMTNGLASKTYVDSHKWDWSEVTNKPSIPAANHTHESITSSNGEWDLLQIGDGRAVIKPAYYSATAGGLTIKMFTALPMEDIYNHSSNATIRTPASADFFLGDALGVHVDGYILSNTDFVITNKVTYNSHVVIQDSMEISFASGVGYPESFVLGGGAEIPAPLAKTLVTTDYIKSKVQNVNVNLQSAEDTRVALTNLITILKNL